MNFGKHLIAATIIAAGISATGCQSVPERPPVTDVLLWSTEDDRPEWTFTEGESTESVIYGTGRSNYHTTEKQAVEIAKVNAAANISQKLGAISSKDITSETVSSAKADDIANETISVTSVENVRSKALLNKISYEDIYIEMWKKADGQTMYIAFAKAAAPKAGSVNMLSAGK